MTATKSPASWKFSSTRGLELNNTWRYVYSVMKKSKQGQNRVMQRAWPLGAMQSRWVKDREHWRRWRCIGEAWRKDCVQLESPGLGLWLLLWDKYKAIESLEQREKYKHPCVLTRFLSCSAPRLYAEGDYRQTQRGQTEDGHILQGWDCSRALDQLRWKN